MLSYEPGETLGHRLDPRTKLILQGAFVAAAFASSTPTRLGALTLVALGMLAGVGLSPMTALGGYRVALPFLVAGPVVASLSLGPPWVVPDDAVDPAVASYRVLLVLLVSAAYVRSTPVRDSRAAIQHTIPGRAGQFLGVGVALVFRFLPALVADLQHARDASAARLGDQRPLVERVRWTTVAGLNRAFGRADRLALALRARCFAWNPTLPHLTFGRIDAPALVAAGLLVAFAVS
ncbi:MAG: energy-coupling factor transporter transmembrane component T family protein [Halobacteriota archaeon]